jgi:hypothetical protein
MPGSQRVWKELGPRARLPGFESCFSHVSWGGLLALSGFTLPNCEMELW